MSATACTQTDLPDYVVYDPENPPAPAVLTQPAQMLAFPLSAEDRADIDILTTKYDQEENCAGLAAPQIGIPKRIIVFAVEDDPQLKKWRPDLSDTMPKSVWINPSYEGIAAEGTHEDYEACFSVKDIAGNVERFNTIIYEAHTPEGERVTGKASGFLARLIQHETDHIDGILFSKRAKPGTLMPMDIYRQKRREAQEGDGR